MDKKSLILIVVCIIVFSFVCLSYLGVFNHEETLQVGEINFKLPEGYKLVGKDKDGNEKITNGLDSILFTYYDDTNVSQHVNNYIKYCNSKKWNVNSSNFTTNGVVVYETVTSTGSNHYWFVYKDKTYAFFTSKETFNIDDIAHSLIDSAISK